MLLPFDKEAARDYQKFPTPEEPKFSGPSRSSPSSIASGSNRPESPIAPEIQGLPGRVPRKPPPTGLSPSRLEPPVEDRGGRATEDLEDLLLEGPSPSKKATKRAI